MISTLLRLGPINVIIVFIYRIAIHFGVMKIFLPVRARKSGYLISLPLSFINNIQQGDVSVISKADEIRNGKIRFFSDRLYDLGSPPDWFLNPINGKSIDEHEKHWSKIKDFNSGIGDIKCVWEASRFNWVLILARAYLTSKDEIYLATFNDWISNWILKNPRNAGPNWKCGQEASIRVLNVLLAVYILKLDRSPTEHLINFVTEHCERIEPTILYAISQDNNHGISEASALFICGGWLKRVGTKDLKLGKNAVRWERIGRFWLENRIVKLIEDDGSFSQKSVNYHRLVIDTLSIVKFWQEYLALGDFSAQFFLKARAAVQWLFQMVDPLSGDAPNFGANDGSLLFSLTSCDYRDFRPSVQLGAGLFFNSRAYDQGPWDEVLSYFELKNDKFSDDLKRRSLALVNGGYVVFLSDSSWGVVHVPNYRFRPGHADALHFDLWYKGRNILRDGGSYSYNCLEPWQSYFPGTKSHNTIEFDNRDQMPRISRFLWGKWTKGKTIEPLTERDNSLAWTGEYLDFKGCRHQRSVSVKGDCWHIKDIISGHKKDAVLRWRLEPGEWALEGNICRNRHISIKIENINILKLNLVDGWESRYYLQKSKLPVLEALIEDSPYEINTEIKLSAS